MREMALKISLVAVLCLTLACCAALERPADDDHKDRVYKEELSDEPHYMDEDEHNPDYDHEAFLGEDEARTFDQLTPEESIDRLGKIVDKIDGDKDGFVTMGELKAWIEFNQKKYITEDVQQQWNTHNVEGKKSIAWPEYKKIVYGFLGNMDENELKNDEEGQSYASMMQRDERRWERADLDSDTLLTEAEFTDFLHPEDADRMKDLVVTETMEDVDKDKDGKLSMDEYIGDMYKGELNDDEPEWVMSERKQFQEFRDKDKSGFLELDEVRAWIMPSDYNHAEAEAKHLLHESDENKDEKLTKDEILDKYDLFVGSQATDFGEALMKHDEF